jgi:hypothetical protein
MTATEKYISQLAAVVDSLHIHGTTSLSWHGIHQRILPNKVRSHLTEEDIRSCLVSTIETQLYRQFYSVGGIHSDSQTFQLSGSQASEQQFVQMLSDANHGDDHFDPGWCVLSVGESSLTIMKDGIRLTTDAVDCNSEESIVQGGTVSLRTSKECLRMTPGFYLAIGSAPGAVRGSAHGPLVRIYWNVTPSGAVKLIDELTRLLNSRGIVFRLKALRDPSTYERCDAAVLYLSKSDFLSIWGKLTRVYKRVSGYMKQGVPALTKRLAPGLGLAEDPDGSTSFGMHRCELIAEGLMRASEARTKKPRLRLKRVIERFEEEGVDVCRPYLNRNSQDDYPSVIVRKNNHSSPHFSAGEPGACLDAAVTIGKALVRSAIYDKDTCTWAGYYAAPAGSSGITSDLFGTIGPCLYDGNSGIAWFLSELFAVTKDDAVGECAIAALNGAISASNSLPDSLFAGWMGVALSAAYSSQYLPCSWLRSASNELLNRLGNDNSPTREPDLLTGDAGMITGLILHAQVLKQDILIKDALVFGRHLIERAERETAGYSWSSISRPNHANLTGLSHGASGIALALFQLYGITGVTEFRELARKGIIYERAYFDSKYKNWSDLRGVRKPAKSSKQYKSSYFWCHGAPGIGISRLAGWHYSHETEYLDEARIAFRSTYEWTSRMLGQNQPTGCLCHGVVGNALVLLLADEAVANENLCLYQGLANSIASRVACKVLQHEPLFGETSRDIDNPSLMLGLAGIGHYLLRAASLPSDLHFMSPVWLQ